MQKRASLHLVRGEAALAEFDRGGLEPLRATGVQSKRAVLRENRPLKRALTDPRIIFSVLDARGRGCNPSWPKKVADRISLAGVAPGAVLEGRYRIDHVVPSLGAQRAFIGTVLETGQYVMLLELGSSAAALLGRALLVSHPNLATLVELMSLPEGDTLGVVEYAEGMTLKERLTGGGKLPVEEAVSYALCAAHALAALHQRGAAHGLVRPASVVLNPRVRGGAVLGYAPPVPPPNPFRNPERGLGAPSPADDVWALAALLHHMLLGRPPPPFGVRAAEDLSAAGITDATLCDLIANCLRPQPAHRISIVSAVRDTLAGWLRGEAAAGPQAAAAVESSRPSAPREGGTPASMPAVPASVPPPAAAGGRSRVLPTLLAGIGVGVIAAAAGAAVVILRTPQLLESPTASEVVNLTRSPAQPFQPYTPSRPGPGGQASAEPADKDAKTSDSVSVDSLLREDELASCVVRQLPEKSIYKQPDFSWLCLTRDPRKGNSKMRKALVYAAGRRHLTKAMRLWSRLRWYGMAGFAVIRTSCCSNAEPLELPKMTGCDPLDEILNELGATVAAGKDHTAVLKRYTKSIKCYSRVGRAHLLRQRTGIGGGQRAAFLRLLAVREGR